MSTSLTLFLTGFNEQVQLILVLLLALACLACLAWIVASTHMHEPWYRVASEKGPSRTGLNAAEKGTSSVAVRAERIPYDLVKRAILHRVSSRRLGLI